MWLLVDPHVIWGHLEAPYRCLCPQNTYINTCCHYCHTGSCFKDINLKEEDVFKIIWIKYMAEPSYRLQTINKVKILAGKCLVFWQPKAGLVEKFPYY